MKELCWRALTDDAEKPFEGAELDRESLSRLDEISEEFLLGYEGVSPGVSRSRLAIWATFELLKDILDCWRKVKFEHLGARLSFLRQNLGVADRGI